MTGPTTPAPAAGATDLLAGAADRAPCADCLAEIDDGSSRRYGYAFTSCAACGPRWSIAVSSATDRAGTTLAAFTMCPECRREWDDPADRRHHAPALACPACGPHLAWHGPGGHVAPGESDRSCLARAAAALRAGNIVGVLGTSGFVLACDATDVGAVARLRARKHRPWKPLAVLVETLGLARALVHVDDAAAALLAGPRAPTVVLPVRHDAGLAPGIAPGLLDVGVRLAATPLQRLLCRQVGRPLAVTSAHVGAAPLETSIGAVRERLPGMADGWLWHDRGIARAMDASVVRLMPDGPLVLRRGLGWVPEPVRLPHAVPEPILAVGGHHEATACIAVGNEAFVTEHLGDMDDPDVVARWLEAVASLQQALGVVPRVVAHDLHPGWPTTRAARERRGARLVAVQHHHAHAAAVMAERGLTGPVLALAFEGGGWGADATGWGGELLLVDGARSTRLATLAPLPMVGGDRAVAEPWRLALAALVRALGEGAGIARFSASALGVRVAPPRAAQAAALLATDRALPRTRAAGSWIDAAAALALGLPTSSANGELAARWEAMAGERAGDPWPHDARAGLPDEGLVLDLAPAMAALSDGVAAGEPPATLAARWHATLAEVARTMLATAAPLAPGVRDVVLAGGCWQNARLVATLREGAGAWRLHRPLALPPGDGGLSLGQAWVAGQG